MAIVGIDLGTTNSLVTHWDGERPALIPNALGELLTPSVVGVDDDGEILVGAPARDRLQTHPRQTVAAFKRIMGTSKAFELGQLELRAEELSALVLRSLKADAEAHLGEPVTDAVISVPAYFNDAQRKATRNAGAIAGLEVRRLINEPTAAAIAYGLHEKPEFSTIMVLDLGGGTFDVSVLEMFEGVMQVHASAGDNHLGGEDFVDVLVAAFAEAVGIDLGESDPHTRSALRQAAERCKRQLSAKREAVMRVRVGEEMLEHPFTRQAFERIAEALVARIRSPVERALRDASLGTADLDAVVLVGGASRMPVLRTISAQMLGRLPFTHINPDETVALGTAVQVGLMSGDSALDEIVLTDVAPYSLGIGILNRHARADRQDLFSPIIERNTPVPVSRVGSYCTVHDDQTRIEIEVYQGEARLVRDNIRLGALTIHVPPARAGEQTVDVRFTYDINGLLEVEVESTSSGNRRRLVIEGEEGTMSSEEIDRRLSALTHLKVHPREQMENRAVLARGERLYSERLGEARDYVQRALSDFEGVLESQDERRIARAREELSAILDELESDSPF